MNCSPVTLLAVLVILLGTVLTGGGGHLTVASYADESSFEDNRIGSSQSFTTNDSTVNGSTNDSTVNGSATTAAGTAVTVAPDTADDGAGQHSHAGSDGASIETARR